MRYSRLWLCVFLFFGLTFQAFADKENLFKKYNPDVNKYEFAKSYIMGLGYYSRVALRLAKEDSDLIEGVSVGKPLKLIQGFIVNRTLDNTEIRIARNYLVKYNTSANGLIRQVTADAVAAYDQLLEISMRERELWQVLARVRKEVGSGDPKEADILRHQVSLAGQKKEAAKDLIRASLKLNVVFLSAELCDNEECKKLVLTRDERYKLLAKLDAFGKDTMDWGAKAGQTTLQACVASIREVLEDPLYISKP